MKQKLMIVVMSALVSARVIGAEGNATVESRSESRTEVSSRPAKISAGSETSASVSMVLEKFEERRTAYLESQAELLANLKVCAETDRETIREQLKSLRAEFSAVKEHVRTDLKDALEKLREQGRKLKHEEDCPE